MNKTRIGIPKALMYYKYKDLWINFFENLDLEVIISESTNDELINNGLKYLEEDTCFPLKIFMGHVYSLINKCDYILIPRIKSINKNEELCNTYSSLYDQVSNIFNVKPLDFNIDINRNENHEYSFITMGLTLGFSYRKSKNAYLKAKEYNDLLKSRKISKEKIKLATYNKPKILLASQSYNLYDKKIGEEISKYLNSKNIEVIYSDNYDKKYIDTESNKIMKNIKDTYKKEMCASINGYQNELNGIILITTPYCTEDKLINKIIINTVTKPIIEISIDENTKKIDLIKKLDSFISRIKGRMPL